MGSVDKNKERKKLDARIAELEQKCRADPMKKSPKLHEELAKLKKKQA